MNSSFFQNQNRKENPQKYIIKTPNFKTLIEHVTTIEDKYKKSSIFVVNI